MVPQLIVNGIVTGCALGMMAMSFSLFYSTARIFHVAHAGVFTLSGYVCWALVAAGLPVLLAMVLTVLIAALLGLLIQHGLYNRLRRRRATDLVILIGSLGLLAIIENATALLFSANFLQFPGTGAGVVRIAGLFLNRIQIATVVAGLVMFAGAMYFTQRTVLGKRVRALSSNPFLAEITGMRPEGMYALVLAIASGMVAVPGMLLPMDLGLQPYGGVTLMLTATVAMIAGGIGSLFGAFVLALGIAVLQNVSLLVLPGVWSLGVTFLIFVIFMLFRPRGLFAA